MTVAEAQSRITAREFAEWQAFDQVEPFGDARADLRAGIVAATLANCNRARGQKAFAPDDFMPKFDEARPSKSPDEMFNLLRVYAEVHNAGLSKKRGGR